MENASGIAAPLVLSEAKDEPRKTAKCEKPDPPKAGDALFELLDTD